MSDSQDNETQPQLPSKGFVALLYLPLMVPALLPLYFATQEDDPALIAIMVGTGVMVLVVNAAVLIGAYRWFASKGASDE